MSDDEADPELLELLRQSLGLNKRPTDEVSSDTGVLEDAEHIYGNSIDVLIDMHGTKAAASSLFKIIQQRGYSTQNWSQHELHPTPDQGFSEVDIVNFVFTMDVLNFSFWSELSEDQRFQVQYLDKRWTGYKSLLACLRRALDDGVPVTTPRFWIDPACTNELLRNVFRSATQEPMPLLGERISMLRDIGHELQQSFVDPDDDKEPIDQGREVENSTGKSTFPRTNTTKDDNENSSPVAENPQTTSACAESKMPADEKPSSAAVLTDATSLDQQVTSPTTSKPVKPDHSIVRLINKADRSAGKLVNLLAKHFPSFRDETRFDGKRVRLLKRAQIFVADLWAAFNGTGYGEFNDIGALTMFADYRVPQMLRSLSVLTYSPPLHHAISSAKDIPSGHTWEVQLRGCSIWAVELIRREILRQHPEAEATGVNAVLIDFLLYDLAKEREAAGVPAPAFHRTRSIWY